MGQQLAAAFHMMTSDKSVLTFEDGLVVGLPIMVALVFGIIPMGVIPSMLKPLIGNGFVMGVITVILLEHIVFRKSK